MIILPMLSSRSFMVSGLIFRSLIKPEFTFMCGFRRCCNLVLSNCCPDFLAPFTEVTAFPPIYVLTPLWIVASWVSFWVFEPSPLIYISVCGLCHTGLFIVSQQYTLKSGSLILLAPFFFSMLHWLFEILCVSTQIL